MIHDRRKEKAEAKERVRRRINADFDRSKYRYIPEKKPVDYYDDDTGRYYEPIARYLHEAGIFVSVVNAIVAHNYSGNSLRKVKTDKIDAVKLANMAIDRWLQLQEYVPEDEIRQTLKICNRQYNQYNKLKTIPSLPSAPFAPLIPSLPFAPITLPRLER